MITAGLKETFQIKTLVLLAFAVVAFMLARLLHQHVIGRVAALRAVPEVSDIIVMIVGAGLLRGDNSIAWVIGSGISLVNNLGTRLRLPWLRVG